MPRLFTSYGLQDSEELSCAKCGKEMGLVSVDDPSGTLTAHCSRKCAEEDAAAGDAEEARLKVIPYRTHEHETETRYADGTTEERTEPFCDCDRPGKTPTFPRTPDDYGKPRKTLSLVPHPRTKR